MFAFANFLGAAAHVVDILLTVYYWLILIRAVISWVSPDPFNPLVQFLVKSTEPVLEPIRRILPAGLRFGIDISPLIAFLLIVFLRSFLVRTLVDWSLRLG
ncbi:MAG: YggT family protein [Candidatus Omnitrophota bacterium]|jgi:YggT family protein|nr:YggT family protein [Candidatus Omnitrophota bacterium]MDD3983486.1 YggT family protein [Candidatus Omnitrophota bacterium]MDD5526154.1 YggT family protein [Candidatus Omnitrophota bacterium]